jgi:predicted transcriptional regulator YdeE
MRESHNREIKDITKLADIMQTMDQIYSNWLPNSAYRRVAAPDFEFYDEHFSGDDSPMYVYVPITSA